LEPAIAGDIAFIRAWKVDEVGNCVFRYGKPPDSHFSLLTWRLGIRFTANNFNAPMAKNAKLTIVEVCSYLS